MELLVEFLMINYKHSHDNLWLAYIERILSNLLDKKFITEVKKDQSVSFFDNEPPVSFFDNESSIVFIEHNIYAINFIYRDDKYETNWSIVFEFGTFNLSNQLQITIYSSDYKLETGNYYLENLKLAIKDFLKSDWEKIVWIMDKDSEMLSIELYPMIYRVENLARQLINQVMIKEYGIKWWDTYVPIHIKNKHRTRLFGYKSVAPGFRNVDELLMSIDIGDLISIFMLKEKKWIPEFNNEISQYLKIKSI